MKRTLILLSCLLLLCVPAGRAGAITPEAVKKIEQMKQAAVEFMQQGKYNKAIPLLREIVSLNPGDKTAARYLILARQQLVEPFCKEAAEAYFENNYARAIEQWDNILRISADDRRAFRLIEMTKNLIQDNALDSMHSMVEKFLKEEKYQQAVSELEKVLIINPEDRMAQDLLKSTTKTITDNEIKAHYEKADSYMQLKRYDLAVEEWRAILRLDQDQEAAARLIASTIRDTFLGTEYSNAEKMYVDGSYASALEQYNRIMLDNPTDQYVRKIIERLKSVVKITPKVEGAGQTPELLRKSVANYVPVDGNHRIALAAAWYASQIEPDNKMAHSLREFLERELANVMRSMEYPVRDMNLVDQYLFASLNNIYAGRYDLAIQQCNLVLELEPNSVLALKRLGSAHFAMKNKEKAKEAWERALSISPGDGELKKFLSQVRNGPEARKRGGADDASN